MILLILVSLIWAVSFGLIRTYLANVDPDVINSVRLALTLLVFLPFLAGKRVSRARNAELVAIGAVQFGLMYALYTRSYGLLQAHQVALATLMTPLYVALLDDLLERRLRPHFVACAALAAVGTWISIGAGSLGEASLQGLALVQAANFCFATGQIWYRRAMARTPGLGDRQAFARCAVGAAAVAVGLAAPAWWAGAAARITLQQMAVLVYLGVVASGLGFFLWNVGARKVNTGVLAVMNDLKIPLGVVVSLMVFGERALWGHLLSGAVILGAAWWLAARDAPQ